MQLPSELDHSNILNHMDEIIKKLLIEKIQAAWIFMLETALIFILRASLVAQWLRICLPMQGTRVRALVWEDPTCRGATKPVSHNYWACATGACAPQQEGRDSERPVHRDEEWPPLAATRESPRTETKAQHSQTK